MGFVVKLTVVIGLGAVELWAAAPAGLAMHIHPIVIFVSAAAGAVMGGMVVVLLGERVRGWIRRRRGGDGEGKKRGWPIASGSGTA